MTGHRTSRTDPSVRLMRALDRLKYEPSDAEIAEGRADYLDMIKTLDGRTEIDRWVDFLVLLRLRDAITALATGEYDPEYRLKFYRRAYCVVLAAKVADTPRNELPNISVSDQEFAEQAEAAMKLHGRIR